MELFVGNLSSSVSEQTLDEIFGLYGPVHRTRVVRDALSGKSRNFAFVEMGSNSEAAAAISTAEDAKNGMRRMRATDWEPSEVSLVPVGADANAGVRGQPQKGTCVIVGRSSAEIPQMAAHVKPVTARELHRLRIRLQELQEKESL
jgi:RNA recognition motif-containing protein